MKRHTIMNDIYFATYNQKNDCIEVYINNKLKIMFDCTRLNNNVYLEDPLDIAYLHNMVPVIILKILYFQFCSQTPF